jgi:hypothetical protein
MTPRIACAPAWPCAGGGRGERQVGHGGGEGRGRGADLLRCGAGPAGGGLVVLLPGGGLAELQYDGQAILRLCSRRRGRGRLLSNACERTSGGGGRGASVRAAAPASPCVAARRNHCSESARSFGASRPAKWSSARASCALAWPCSAALTTEEAWLCKCMHRFKHKRNHLRL